MTVAILRGGSGRRRRSARSSCPMGGKTFLKGFQGPKQCVLSRCYVRSGRDGSDAGSTFWGNGDKWGWDGDWCRQAKKSRYNTDLSVQKSVGVGGSSETSRGMNTTNVKLR